MFSQDNACNDNTSPNKGKHVNLISRGKEYHTNYLDWTVPDDNRTLEFSVSTHKREAIVFSVHE